MMLVWPRMFGVNALEWTEVEPTKPTELHHVVRALYREGGQ